MLKLETQRYRRYIVQICAAMLLFAGAQLAELYISVASELAATTNASPEFNMSFGFGAAALITNAVMIGMFGGHLALFGLAAIELMSESGEHKMAAWLAGFSWVGLACVCVIAAAMRGESEIAYTQEDFNFAAALAAYVLAGMALITMRFIGRKR